jgi:membrane protein implicated in regulation of membrane protease activity
MNEGQRKFWYQFGVIIMVLGAVLGIFLANWAPDFFAIERWVDEQYKFLAQIAIFVITAVVFLALGSSFVARTMIVTYEDQQDGQR